MLLFSNDTCPLNPFHFTRSECVPVQEMQRISLRRLLRVQFIRDLRTVDVPRESAPDSKAESFSNACFNYEVSVVHSDRLGRPFRSRRVEPRARRH